MHLLNNPSPGELQSLLSQCKDPHHYYNILVDHKSEVAIEICTNNTRKKNTSHKFCLHGFLRGSQLVGEDSTKTSYFHQQLFEKLLWCWDNNICGTIDQHEINRLQNINYWILTLKKNPNSDSVDYTSFVLKKGKAGRIDKNNLNT